MAKKLTKAQRELLVTLSTGAKLASTWSTSFVVVTEKCTNTTFRFPDGMEKVLKTTVDALDEAGLVEWQKGFCVISEAGRAAIGATPAPVAEPAVTALPDVEQVELSPAKIEQEREIARWRLIALRAKAIQANTMRFTNFADVLKWLSREIARYDALLDDPDLLPVKPTEAAFFARLEELILAAQGCNGDLWGVGGKCALPTQDEIDELIRLGYVIHTPAARTMWSSGTDYLTDKGMQYRNVPPVGTPTFPLDSWGRYPFVDAGKIAKQRAELDNPLPAALSIDNGSPLVIAIQTPLEESTADLILVRAQLAAANGRISDLEAVLSRVVNLCVIAKQFNDPDWYDDIPKLIIGVMPNA